MWISNCIINDNVESSMINCISNCIINDKLDKQLYVCDWLLQILLGLPIPTLPFLFCAMYSV